MLCGYRLALVRGFVNGYMDGAIDTHRNWNGHPLLACGDLLHVEGQPQRT